MGVGCCYEPVSTPEAVCIIAALYEYQGLILACQQEMALQEAHEAPLTARWWSGVLNIFA